MMAKVICQKVYLVLFNLNQFLPLFCFPISGIDDQLARHYAHLFIRDPLTLFQEHIHQDDEQNTDHFEVHKVPFQTCLSSFKVKYFLGRPRKKKIKEVNICVAVFVENSMTVHNVYVQFLCSHNVLIGKSVQDDRNSITFLHVEVQYSKKQRNVLGSLNQRDTDVPEFLPHEIPIHLKIVNTFIQST